MKITGIKGPTFGIYQNTKIRSNGKDTVVSTLGKYKESKITIYNLYEHSDLVGKLYYVADKFDNFIKLKLQNIKDGKIVSQLIREHKWFIQ